MVVEFDARQVADSAGVGTGGALNPLLDLVLRNVGMDIQYFQL